MILFKVLDGKRSCNGGNSTWRLKRWMPAVEVEPCASGYHFCRPKDLIRWLGPDIYIAEGRGKMVECDDKIVYAEARIVRHLDAWNERTARLFACWCARQVWRLLKDKRSRNAVEVAERFAHGEATKDELKVAREAARTAAKAAAWAAAREAAGAADRVAAREAAGAAAGVAAGAAAGAAAGVAAGAAAGVAAGVAAGAAAGVAARVAARAAQTAELMRVLGIDPEEVNP